MYVSNIFLDRFGRRSNLRVDNLCDGLNVVFGPAGSGKSTLVDFLRAMWSGFDQDLRERYLPRDSRGFGGVITIQSPHGRQTISRYDDGGRDGRLTVEREDGAVIGRSHVQDVLGNVSQAFLERAFIVDFQQRPQLSELLQAAANHGIHFWTRPASTVQWSTMERAIAENRERLAKLPRVVEPVEVLLQRRKDLTRELELLKIGANRELEDQRKSIQRLEQEIATAELLERSLQSDLEALDRPSNSTVPADAEPKAEMTSAIGATALAFLAHLRNIDAQIARSKSALRDVIIRKQRAAERVDRAAYAKLVGKPKKVGVCRNLATIAAKIAELEQLHSIQTTAQACQCNERNAATKAGLETIRQDIDQLRRGLQHWEMLDRQRRAIAEHAQLASCEAELRQSMRPLVKRRQWLLRQLTDMNVSTADQVQDQSTDNSKNITDDGTARPALPGAVKSGSTRLDALREAKRMQLFQVQSLLEEHRRQLELAASSGDCNRRMPSVVAGLEEVEQLLRHCERRQELTADLERLESERRKWRDDAATTAIISQASRFLRRLTAGEWTSLQIQSIHDVFIADAEGHRLGYEELNAGLRDQVYLAMCLAIVAACDGEGIHLPIVLNAAFANYPSKHIHDAIALLREFGCGRQILCMTRHSHVVSEARLLNVPVHLLDTEVQTSHLHPALLSNPSQPLLPAPSAPRASVEANDAEEARPATPEYFLAESDPIDRAPSIDEANAARLRGVGVMRVGDLMRISPIELASELPRMGISVEMIESWQSQARLVCSVPGLRPYDARILVACGIADSQQLLNLSPSALRTRVKEFSMTPEGQAILLSGTEAELSRVSDWISSTPDQNHWPKQDRRAAKTVAEITVSDSHAADASEITDSKRKGSSENRPIRKQRSTKLRRKTTERETNVNSTWEGAPGERLHRSHSISHLPCIVPQLANRLEKIGCTTIGSFITTSADSIVDKLRMDRIGTAVVRQWQQAAELLCSLPRLTGLHAQILVAIGVVDVAALVSMAPDQLWQRVHVFCETLEGKRLLRAEAEPTVAEVAEWTLWARNSKTLNAA